MQNYQIVTPNWFKVEQQKNISTCPNNKFAKEHNQPAKKSAPVINEAVCPACTLAPNENFSFVFHKNKMKDLEIPKVNGSDICLNFQVEGKYKSTCAWAKSHVKLEPPVQIKLCKFVKAMKENSNAFRAKFRQEESTSAQNAEGETDIPPS